MFGKNDKNNEPRCKVFFLHLMANPGLPVCKSLHWNLNFQQISQNYETWPLKMTFAMENWLQLPKIRSLYIKCKKRIRL